jgi:hypothetical protein
MVLLKEHMSTNADAFLEQKPVEVKLEPCLRALSGEH